MMRNSMTTKLIAMFGALLGLFLLFRFLEVKELLGSFLDWIRGLGFGGAVVLSIVYVVTTVLMAPGFILTMGAGFAFGLVWGTVIISIASTAGAACAFLVGRTVARDLVAQKLGGHPKFAAIDQAVGAEGFKIVLLIRLVPVFPYNLMNYLLSLTKVNLRDYVIASWIGMAPSTILYVYFGTAAKSIAELVSGEHTHGPGRYILLGVGLLATVIVMVYMTKVARRAIDRYVLAETPSDTAPVEPLPAQQLPTQEI